jgi:hypothetical protein
MEIIEINLLVTIYGFHLPFIMDIIAMADLFCINKIKVSFEGAA